MDLSDPNHTSIIVYALSLSLFVVLAMPGTYSNQSLIDSW